MTDTIAWESIYIPVDLSLIPLEIMATQLQVELL